MSKCPKCSIEKTKDNTYICSGRLGSYCKECTKRVAKSSFHKNRYKAHPYAVERKKRIVKANLDFVNRVKSIFGCCLCKNKYPVECLDCHHLDASEKEDNIAYFVRLANNKKLFAELVKCVVVCANCHRQIHSGKLSVTEDNLITLDGFDLTYNDNPLGKRKRKPADYVYKREKKNHCAGCNRLINYGCKTCVDCRERKTKIEWPPKEELEKLILSLPVTRIAKQLGVSDKAVVKRCIKYGIK